MAGLKQIKSKIRSTEKTRKVTKAMEAVSAAKMRKAQNRALRGRAYARSAVSVLARVAGSREMERHPLTQKRALSAGKQVYIVITSDKGLAGALNSAVLRSVSTDISVENYSHDQTGIIAVGRKANDFFLRRGFAIEAFHEHREDAISPELIGAIVREAVNRFSMGECDVVKIAYQHFISTFEQRPTLRTIFPLSLEELSKVVGDIVPKKGASSGIEPPIVSALYTVEPSAEEVLKVILPKLAGIFVYHALLESQASEHSARMVAMKSATEKGEEMQHALTLQFNKARQAAITREVSEITGGMEAMNSH